MGTRVLTLEEGMFLMEANRKTTRRRVRREIRRMGTRAAGHEVISETENVHKIRKHRTKQLFHDTCGSGLGIAVWSGEQHVCPLQNIETSRLVHKTMLSRIQIFCELLKYHQFLWQHPSRNESYLLLKGTQD